MDAGEIVIHVMQRHRHAHLEILPLNVARGNMRMVGVARDYCLASAHADRGAVARLWPLFSIAVNLLEHGEINLCSEYIFDRVKICAMPIGCGLHTAR